MADPYAPPTEMIRKTMIGAEAYRKSLGEGARTSQTIAIEWADYLKAFAEQAAATTKALAKADHPAKALAIQSAFAKASGEQFVQRAATFRGLYATLARQMTTPFAVVADRTVA